MPQKSSGGNRLTFAQTAELDAEYAHSRSSKAGRIDPGIHFRKHYKARLVLMRAETTKQITSQSGRTISPTARPVRLSEAAIFSPGLNYVRQALTAGIRCTVTAPPTAFLASARHVFVDIRP
jgi:hypothetical protein